MRRARINIVGRRSHGVPLTRKRAETSQVVDQRFKVFVSEALESFLAAILRLHRSAKEGRYFFDYIGKAINRRIIIKTIEDSQNFNEQIRCVVPDIGR